MSWDVDLAKELKKGRNLPQYGAVIGKVISVSPLQVSIYGGRVMVTSTNGRTAVPMYKVTCLHEEDHQLETDLSAGDEVVCLPAEGGQFFFIMGKL